MHPDFARQYYESAHANHWWFQGRKDLIARLLADRGVDSGVFVDLGAGAESVLPVGVSVVKMDVVRPDGIDGWFVQGSAEQLPFASNAFDGAGAFDLLEHLERPVQCLREVARIVRPGGLVLVTVPAYQRLWSPHDDLVGHKRRYTSTLLTDTIRQANLTVEWVSGFYRFLLLPALVRALWSLESSMALPPRAFNSLLTSLARKSAASALRRPKRLGLSLVAVARVPNQELSGRATTSDEVQNPSYTG